MMLLLENTRFIFFILYYKIFFFNYFFENTEHIMSIPPLIFL